MEQGPNKRVGLLVYDVQSVCVFIQKQTNSYMHINNTITPGFLLTCTYRFLRGKKSFTESLIVISILHALNRKIIKFLSPIQKQKYMSAPQRDTKYLAWFHGKEKFINYLNEKIGR